MASLAPIADAAAAAAATVAAQHSQCEDGALDCDSRLAAEMETGSARWCGCR